jgi:4-hydroxy-3-polyprenylbenzoate decarboxylase
MSLPDGFRNPTVCLPGIAAIEGPRIEPRPTLEAAHDESIWATAPTAPWSADIERLTRGIDSRHPLHDWPLIVIVDDSHFAAASLENFLWLTFTRSNPAADVHGVEAAVHQKHWGCRGPLVIDARLKPHHAPPVEEDPAVSARVDDLCRRGGPLADILGRT